MSAHDQEGCDAETHGGVDPRQCAGSSDDEGEEADHQEDDEVDGGSDGVEEGVGDAEEKAEEEVAAEEEEVGFLFGLILLFP